MQPTTDKIFVSYSRHDEAFARKLAVWLANTLNLGVWIDIDDIQPGVKWSSAIQDGLDNCEVMVVIVTPESMESINVEDEWQYFIDLGKPVVPILLRSAPIPYQLRRIQWIDFSDRDEYNNSLRQLIVELRQHLKPTDGEVLASSASRNGDTHGTVVQSKKAKKGRRRMKQAEDLIEQQSRALKRTNRLITLVVALLVVAVAGGGGLLAWFYLNQPTTFVVLGDTTGALAVLPGEIEFQALAQLGDELPVGTRIEAGASPLTLLSEGRRVETVLQPETVAAINDLSDDALNVTLTNGNVSAETNGASGLVKLANGVDIAINNNIEVEVDAINDEVTSSCFEGTCTVTDTNNGETVNLEQGQRITFRNSTPNITEVDIESIPGEIAYVTNQHGTAELYLMRPDGSNQTRLTNNTQIKDEAPTWAPDGSALAFVSNRGNSQDIWRVASTGDEEAINLTNSFAQDSEPAWSPDGQFIAFVSNRENGVDDLYVMTAEGEEVTRITFSGGNQSPTWSPDSQQIAFSSRSTGNDEIYTLFVFDPDAEPINITNHPASDTDPAWSHDGTRMAFVSDRDNNPEIYVQTLDSADAPLNISRNSGRDFEPTWSPTSTRVMFTSERFGNLDIVSVSITIAPNATEAEGVTQLTDASSESDQQAAWLPVIRAGQD